MSDSHRPLHRKLPSALSTTPPHSRPARKVLNHPVHRRGSRLSKHRDLPKAHSHGVKRGTQSQQRQRPPDSSVSGGGIGTQGLVSFFTALVIGAGSWPEIGLRLPQNMIRGVGTARKAVKTNNSSLPPPHANCWALGQTGLHFLPARLQATFLPLSLQVPQGPDLFPFQEPPSA